MKLNAPKKAGQIQSQNAERPKNGAWRISLLDKHRIAQKAKKNGELNAKA
jgi:hypothetical protein